MKERDFQKKVIDEIKERLPGCMVIKQDATYIQGIPDLLILHNDKWAALEVKISSKANVQSNQEYYIDKMNKMSHAYFINPDNEKEVLDEIQQTL